MAAAVWIYVIEGILAIFVPPLVAFMQRGCSLDLLINIIFTLLGWIPGIIHAWYLLFADYDNERKGIESANYNPGVTNTATAFNPPVGITNGSKPTTTTTRP